MRCMLWSAYLYASRTPPYAHPLLQSTTHCPPSLQLHSPSSDYPIRRILALVYSAHPPQPSYCKHNAPHYYPAIHSPHSSPTSYDTPHTPSPHSQQHGDFYRPMPLNSSPLFHWRPVLRHRRGCLLRPKERLGRGPSRIYAGRRRRGLRSQWSWRRGCGSESRILDLLLGGCRG